MGPARIARGKPLEYGVLARCPRCLCLLRLGHDMWGRYWLCDECGFAADDDDRAALTRQQPPECAAPALRHPGLQGLGDRKVQVK